MWESEEVVTVRKQLRHSLEDFKISRAAGPERCAYHRGILEGLKMAETLPAKQQEIALKLAEKEQAEVAKVRRFKGLRFAG